MTRARATTGSRLLARRMAPVVLAMLAAGWPLAAAAQQADGLRGALASGAPTAGPLRPAPRAGPLDPVRATPLSAQGAMARTTAPARPLKQTGEQDEELDGASADEDRAARAARRRRDTLPDPTLARRADETQAPDTPAADGADGTDGTDGSSDAGLVTGTVRASRIDAADPERNAAARPTTERAMPLEGPGRPPERDPYDAPGLRVGTFLLRPTLDQGIEWTSNATNMAGGGSDFVSGTTLRLDAASDWARHSASFDGYGTYRTSVTGSGLSEFRGAANAALHLDLGHALRLDSRLGYERKPEEASSPVSIAGAASRPLRSTYSAGAGLEKTAGRLQLGLAGGLTRNTYGDVALTGGGFLSQADRNHTLYTATLRGGYAASPALAPFLEAETGRRLHDAATDSAGYTRSATRYGIRAGLAFDFGEKLNGEISAGWLSEKPDDARLAAVSGLSAAANVQWSPVRGTIVSLTGATEVEGSTTPGQSGSLLYSSTLAVSRELRANLTGTAALDAAWRRYAGTGDRDFTWGAEASLTWWLWRYAGLKARARHEQTTSTLAGRDSRTTSVYLGVTLRR